MIASLTCEAAFFWFIVAKPHAICNAHEHLLRSVSGGNGSALRRRLICAYAGGVDKTILAADESGVMRPEELLHGMQRY